GHRDRSRVESVQFAHTDVAAVDVIDPQPYDLQFVITPEPERALRNRLRGASRLFSDRDEPAAGASGLIGTARGDYRRLLAALYSEGYYAGAISLRIEGREAADLPLDTRLPETARVVAEIDTGPRFTFGRTAIVNRPPAATDPADLVPFDARLAFRRGEVAAADAIGDAADEAVEAWRQLGFPKAQVADREVVADHSRTALDAEVTLAPGRRARFGEVRVEGSRRVNPLFIRHMTDITTGREYDPDDVREAEERLRRMDVFRSVRIVEAEEIDENGDLALTVEAQDRLPRRFGVGATFVTSTNVSEDAVYVVVSAVFENLEEFKKLHPAFANLKAEEMVSDGLSAPLHPGAAKYYREKGWIE
ncbi:MAG: TAXI family TRAP transporter solute-binding subunit, partial [Acidobacteriota bacterium]